MSSEKSQLDLFSSGLNNQNREERVSLRPLPFRVRPQKLEEFVGWPELQKRYPFILRSPLPSMVFWGPPGTGKTTLAQLLAEKGDHFFFPFSAVMGNLAEIRQLMDEANARRRLNGQLSVIFIDEIHRFNKAQQDALLPHVEAGHFILMGATTENPRTSINRALISRIQLVELFPLDSNQIISILQLAQTKVHAPFYPNEIWEILAERADGDARRSLNFLDILMQAYPEGISQESWNEELKQEMVQTLFQNKRDYDQQGDRHYDVVSAYIKSLRGSDPDAALLWLAVMLDGGEDPLFIARRLMIFAAEDVGNSDPWGMILATSIFTALTHIGMPEGRILLAQATTYLASTVKSNASYLGIDSALQFVKEHPTVAVPEHLRNHSPEKIHYKYPHHFPGHFVQQSYTKQPIPHFYAPSGEGREKFLLERLKALHQN